VKLTVKSVIVGGSFTIFFAILPALLLPHPFCCMLAVIGGIVPVFYHKRKSAEKISYVKGMLLGFAGALSAVAVAAVPAILLSLATSAAVSSIPAVNMLGLALVVVFLAVLYPMLGAVGGLLGAIIYGRENIKDEYDYDTDYVKKLKKEREGKP
jgi:hypothetical protein